MNASFPRARALPAAAGLLVSASAVSFLILSGLLANAPRLLGLYVLILGLSILIWRLSATGRLTLPKLDQFAWALLLCYPVLVSRVRDPRLLTETLRPSPEIMAEIAIWCLLATYGIVRITTCPVRLRNLFGRASKYGSLLFIAALLSTIYSISPPITIAWSFKLFTILILCALLFDPDQPAQSVQRFLRATYWGLGLLLVEFVLLATLTPEAAFSVSPTTGLWRAGGFLLPPTALSPVAGLVAVLTLIDILSGTGGIASRLTFAGSLLLLAPSLGRAGIVATLFSILLVLLAFRRMRIGLACTFVAGLVLLTFPGLLALVWALVTRHQDAPQILSLTGRVPIWKLALELISAKPLLGWGYVAGSRVALLSATHLWPAPHAHNALLEILLGLGAVGAFLLFALVRAAYAGALPSLRPFPLTAPAAPQRLASLKVLAMLLLLTVDALVTRSFGGAPKYDTEILVGAAFCADYLRRLRPPPGVPGQ